MKFIYIALFVIMIQAKIPSYFSGCAYSLCAEAQNACNNDAGCNQVLNICETRCHNQQSPTCLQSCIFSSNSAAAQQLGGCAVTNQCFKTFQVQKVPCPGTCAPDVAEGEKECELEHDGIADYECIVKYLTNKGRDDCADKKCVCSNTLALDIYVAGCQC